MKHVTLLELYYSIARRGMGGIVYDLNFRGRCALRAERELAGNPYE